MYASARTGRPAHILFVSYLAPPTDLPPARRTSSLRDAFGRCGVRTTILSSTVSGESASEDDDGVVRAADVRACIRGTHRVLDRPGMRVISGRSRRRLTRLIVPDSTVLSWAPAALVKAFAIARRDRPDVVITTSPPESTHLIGLALRRLGLEWIADLRDGWTFEAPLARPYFRRLDRTLERLIVRSAACVTAASGPLASDLARTGGPGARVIDVPNGFDPRAIEHGTDERGLLDPERFSLIYTGTGRLDGKDPIPFLGALARFLEERPRLRGKLEVVFAGNFLPEEAAAMQAPSLLDTVRFVGRLSHQRAVGLQRSGDGLLLITTAGVRSIATGKLYEYVAARKPILALAEGSAAAALLQQAGGHIIAPPDNEGRILQALGAYFDAWVHKGRLYEYDSGFDLTPYTTDQIGRRLLDLLVELGALRRR
jgi:glycosyltransferase involved in cell wall biosynthesis